MNKYKAVATKVTKYLKDRGVYDSVDDTLVVELIRNLQLCDDAWSDIEDRGIQVNIRKSAKDQPYLQVNQSVTIYNSALKMVAVISTKLGVTVQDRTKLGLKPKAKKSPLDMLLENE